MPHEAPDSPVRLRRRASVFLWIAGAIEVLLMGCMAAALFVATIMPMEQIIEHGRATEQQAQEIRQLKDTPGLITATCIGIVVLGVLPGAAYLVLGFFVRLGKRGAMAMAQALLLMQCILLGLFTIGGIYNALMMGDPTAMTMVVLIFGSMVGLLGYTCLLLHRARLAQSVNLDTQSDPWSHQTPGSPGPRTPGSP